MSSRLRLAALIGGLAAIALALMPPTDRWSERLLSVHMAQHLLLMLVAPPLLLLSGPVQLALKRSPRPLRRALVRALSSRLAYVLTRPSFGVAAFAAVMLASHLTGMFELALRNELAHACEHAAYLLAGLALFAPLLAPASGPLPRPPGGIARFLWLTLAMVPMTLVGALLWSDTHVRYRAYIAPARALGRSALADQHLAGVAMWVGGGLIAVVLSIALAFYAMLVEERRQRRREAYEGALHA
jgi:cytochrome c oxidase assembly factor CtaG